MKKSKLTTRRKALLRNERRELENELAVLPQVAALTFISQDLLENLEAGARQYRVPLQTFAMHYSAFQAVLVQTRIHLIDAELNEAPLH